MGEHVLPGRVSELESMQSTLGSMTPTALAGIDALLQLVRVGNSTASTEPWTGTERSSPALVTDHAVQIAAAALGQLSQAASAVSPVTSGVGPLSELLAHVGAQLMLVRSTWRLTS